MLKINRGLGILLISWSIWAAEGVKPEAQVRQSAESCLQYDLPCDSDGEEDNVDAATQDAKMQKFKLNFSVKDSLLSLLGWYR